MSFNVSDVIEQFQLGNITDSFDMVKKGCKTKPELMAYRLAKVVGALVDPDGFHKNPDDGARFLRLWGGQIKK
jgi:hypothetical protein